MCRGRSIRSRAKKCEQIFTAKNNAQKSAVIRKETVRASGKIRKQASVPEAD